MVMAVNRFLATCAAYQWHIYVKYWKPAIKQTSQSQTSSRWQNSWYDGGGERNRALCARFLSYHYPNGSVVTSKEWSPAHAGRGLYKSKAFSALRKKVISRIRQMADTKKSFLLCILISYPQ